MAAMRFKWRWLAAGFVAGAFFAFAGWRAGAEMNSKDSPFLQRNLQRFPEADANGDGVLTESEARDYMQKAGTVTPKRRQDAGKNADQGTGQDADEVTSQPSSKMTPEGSMADAEPTFSNVSYGPYPANVLDFWKAPSDKPTPLVVYIHGGGFVGGDKAKGRNDDAISQCLKDGISFASINYRFRAEAPVQDIVRDCARAIQFLRYKSKEWSIDKPRVAAYGGSAGASSSLWLAFHDDLADPDNPDPVLRESSRLCVAGANSTQCSCDVEQWTEAVGPYPGQRSDAETFELYHFKSKDDLYTAEGKRIRADVDMLGLMSKDDAPFFAYNPAPMDPPTNHGQYVHHPRHALALKKQAEEVGLECAVFVQGTPVPGGLTPPQYMWKFLYDHLGVKAASAPVSAPAQPPAATMPSKSQKEGP